MYPGFLSELFDMEGGTGGRCGALDDADGDEDGAWWASPSPPPSLSLSLSLSLSFPAVAAALDDDDTGVFVIRETSSRPLSSMD